jgi:DNA-binding NarL/FixJ family response regulator
MPSRTIAGEARDQSSAPAAIIERSARNMSLQSQNTEQTAATKWSRSDIAPNSIALSDLGIPEGHVLVLGLLPLGDGVLETVRAGGGDLVMQGVPFEEFLRTIRMLVTEGSSNGTTARGTLPASAGVLPERALLEAAKLTGRERQVMELIGAGLSNKQIAAQLNVAVHTVKTHVHKVLGKLAVRTRLQVAALVHSGNRVQTGPRISRVA